MTRGAHSPQRVLTWTEAHRLAGAAQLVPPAERGRGPAPSPAIGPGPVAYVDGPGHGSGALGRLAEALASSLGGAAVAIRAPEAELLGTVGAALAVAAADDAIALAEQLATGELRRRPVIAVAPGAVRNYFSRALLGRRRIVCESGDSAQRARAVAEELAQRLGADLALHDLAAESDGDGEGEAGLRRAAATAGASLVVVGGGPAVGPVARELIDRCGAPVVLA